MRSEEEYVCGSCGKGLNLSINKERSVSRAAAFRFCENTLCGLKEIATWARAAPALCACLLTRIGITERIFRDGNASHRIA